MPRIVPRPPISAVPPSTTAAITSSSKPTAGIGRAAAEAGGDDDAGERRGDAGQDIDRERDAADVDAGPAHRLGVGADRGDVAAEAGLGEHEPAGDSDEHARSTAGSGTPRNQPRPISTKGSSDAIGIEIALGQQQGDAAQMRTGRPG